MKFDFSSLQRSVQTLASQIKGLRKQIEDLQREREDVQASAAAKSDVKRIVAQWVESKRAVHAKVLRATLEPFIRKPANLDDAGRVNQYLTVLGGTLNAGGQASVVTMDAVICGLFGSQVLDGLNTAIDLMDWPQEGLPLVDRARRLDELDAEIAALVEQEQELTESARQAGLVVE